MTINSRSTTHQGNLDRSRKAFHLFLCLNLFLSMLSLAIPSFEAEAAIIFVNETDDELNSDGDCSLREAIQAANTNTAVDACTAGESGYDIISINPGTYMLSITGDDEDNNMEGDLDILENLGIYGGAMDTTIIEGDSGWTDRIIDVQNGVNLSLSYVTLRNGNVDGDGGGLRFRGIQLNIDYTRINDNQASEDGGGVYNETTNISSIEDSYIHDNSCTGSGCDGGGIYTLRSLVLNRVEVYQNSAQDQGGGVYLADGLYSLNLEDTAVRANQADLGGGISTPKLNLFESEISNNTAILTAGGMGGGIYYWGAGNIQIRNATISGNQANSDGGGMAVVGSSAVYLNNATITDNEANADSSGTDYGGGIYLDSSPTGMVISNTIIAENLVAGVVNADHADCTNDGGTLTSWGHNLQGLQSSTMTCNFSGDGDMQGTVSSPIDPRLGPLQENDGPTNTHALLPDSPALESGHPDPPDGTYPECALDDQRGTSRPQVTTCDIGAFEAEPNQAPNTPSNPDPADMATDVSVNTVLSWDGGDPDGHPVTYDVYLEAGNPTPGLLLCGNFSTTICDPGFPLDTNETYYWYVEVDDGGLTSTGPVWSFTTSATTPVELLRNNNLELVVPSGWKGGNLETADGSDCATAHGGSCAAALTGASGGETKLGFYGLPGFSGSAGDAFNLSYYNRRQDVGGAGAVQVRVSIRYTDMTMGHFSYVPGVGTADWALFSHDFTAAKDYNWGVVRLIFSKPNGTLWYDDMSLMRNGSEELLNNNDMELRVPCGWKGANLILADGADCTEWHSGTCSAALTGSLGGETKMLFYGIPGFSGSAGDEFTLSYWNKRDSVGGAGAVQVRVSLRYTDATMGHFSFVPGVGTEDWLSFVHEFTAAKDYDWGVIRLIFSKPNGTLWYDDISLTVE